MLQRRRSLTPGEKLRDLLMNCFPRRFGTNSFITDIGGAIFAEEEFAEYLYMSSINYLVRRLITTSRFLRQRCDPDRMNTRVFIEEIRAFLKHDTNLPRTRIERFVALLTDAEEAAIRRLTATQMAKTKRDARKRGETKCYMCGVELNFDTEGQYDSAEIEHIWPLALGGTNDDDNLTMACHSCNQSKRSFINASDYHYEEICLHTDESDPHFRNELSRDYRVALWARNGFTCATCESPAQSVGRLRFRRRNQRDSWHFFNVDAYCDRHSS